MSDGPLPKNPARVPWLSQVLDPIGEISSGRGLSVVRSDPDAPGSAFGTEIPMSDRTAETIKEDGVYENPQKDRFQFRKGHVVPPGTLKTFRKVADYPEPELPGAAEYAETRPDETAKADAEPENKKAPAPTTKTS